MLRVHTFTLHFRSKLEGCRLISTPAFAFAAKRTDFEQRGAFPINHSSPKNTLVQRNPAIIFIERSLARHLISRSSSSLAMYPGLCQARHHFPPCINHQPRRYEPFHICKLLSMVVFSTSDTKSVEQAFHVANVANKAIPQLSMKSTPRKFPIGTIG